jgi:hypothetical protein
MEEYEIMRGASREINLLPVHPAGADPEILWDSVVHKIPVLPEEIDRIST